jgi:hypothetical protein
VNIDNDALQAALAKIEEDKQLGAFVALQASVHEKLAEAVTMFEEDKQLGAFMALQAFVKVVEKTHPKPWSVLKPIHWMMNEFAHDPSTDSGKPLFDAMRGGIAAGAIDLLKIDKMTIAEAARLVARECDLGTAKQLIEFRKNIGRGREKPVAAKARLQFVNTVKAELSETTKKDLRQKAILREVRKTLSYK